MANIDIKESTISTKSTKKRDIDDTSEEGGVN